MLVQMMPRRKINWTATVFWVTYLLVMVLGCWFLANRFMHPPMREVQVVNTCPRLPQSYQQQRIMIT
jgi:hypothetical protein